MSVAIDPRLQDLQLVEVRLRLDEEFTAPEAVHDVSYPVGLREDEIHPLSVRFLHGFDRYPQNRKSRRQGEVGSFEEKICVVIHRHVLRSVVLFDLSMPIGKFTGQKQTP